MDRELLIEIGCEELPASWLPGLTRQLATHLDARLKQVRLDTDARAESYSTPRRLTARVAKLSERQNDHEELVTGRPLSASRRNTASRSARWSAAKRRRGRISRIACASAARRRWTCSRT